MSLSDTVCLSPCSAGDAAWSWAGGQPRVERPLRQPIGARTLAVVAPHPDDETLAARRVS